MAKRRLDPAILDHLEWLGFVRPTGLVVSAPALVRAGAVLDRRDIDGQRRLDAVTEERVFDPETGAEPYVPDFRAFAESVLEWGFSPKAYAGTEEAPIPSELEVHLPEFEETLRPDYAVRELDPKEGGSPWQLLVRVLEPGEDPDRVRRGGLLEASAHGRMERLLRRTGVPAGIVFNGRVVRLISAPHGESSGWLDFRVADMAQTAGRPISTALRLLLSQRRLLTLPRAQRLPALLEDSRKFQNEVSERLAEQVLHALYELLRGLQAAHDASGGELLRHALDDDPDEVYRALLTVVLRLVFVLYAEERDMLPDDETFVRYYSVAGLHERLREDAALHPDTMDQRFGAWAQLLVLFRMVYDGAEAGPMRLPARHGVLFDPDRYPFLEGRAGADGSGDAGRIEPPRVPDGTVYRALEKLLVLDGERLSYRALDVEQIGSVYETMMGFRLEAAAGLSVAIRAPKKHGAPTTVDLEALLEVAPGKRAKWLQDRTDRKITKRVNGEVKGSETLEGLHAALLSVVDKAATPDLVAPGGLVLQPSEERRKSGSHYTPRVLTEPIVRTTLEPILDGLRGEEGAMPRPEAILDLKVCDPAMGSGAFLVEACRQLGDALVEAWHAHDTVPEVPSDEDEVVFARRLVAQRCLYGVDRNPVAVDLAKMSLWLVTLAKDHPLTFVDHALRHGDSLVGLSRLQLEAFHWDPSKPPALHGLGVRDSLDQVAKLRDQIRNAEEGAPDHVLRELWDEAQAALSEARLLGDLAVAAFFEAGKKQEREMKRDKFLKAALAGTASQFAERLAARRYADPPLAPFHWEIEFPEVFVRDRPGFDSILGNPPFMGGSKISSTHSGAYTDYLSISFPESEGKSDLVAYFFRRTFDLIRVGGTSGLIATNTIRQGATRFTALRWIRTRGGYIYSAIRRMPWPGMAAVVVSVVHFCKSHFIATSWLDGQETSTITAYLMSFGPDEEPLLLSANKGITYSGVNPNGKGFVLTEDEANHLIATNPNNADKIWPYLGSVEMNETPTASATRFIIRFDETEEKEVRNYPDLHTHLSDSVRLQRQGSKERRLREKWWLFSRPAEDLYTALPSMSRVLVSGRVATHLTFTFQYTNVVFSDAVTVFLYDDYSSFAVLQSQSHALWAQFQGSSFKDDLRYIPENCFETFPFPVQLGASSTLEACGRAYYDFRAKVMVDNDEGLTATYNRFHDPEERAPEILRLRELHADMDRAVLDAYGWTDIPTDCEFLLEFEIDEETWSPRKKKPWRYRWPDEVHDEVLARLLELNAERAREEVRDAATTAQSGTKSTPRKESGVVSEPPNLFS